MKSLKRNLINMSVNQAISNKTIRDFAVKKLDKQILESILSDDLLPFKEEKLDRYYFVSSVVRQVSKCLDRKTISAKVARKMVDVFMSDSFKPNRKAHLNDTKLEYHEKYGEYPPKFLVLSPEKACNLKCVGCYASCSPGKSPHLEYDLTKKIVQEAHDIFGSRFIVISGGEPLMYRSQGKTILDLFKEFSDTFFLLYTNGTLITEEIAEQLAELGNVVPLISVEGYEKETDERRGKGTYQKIMNAMTNLRNVGVPFGVSVTSTAKNLDLLLTDEFYKFYFDELGASHMWQFQLMPIGRAKETMELTLSPEQRVKLYKKWEHVSRNLRYPMADFWNSASLSTGCLAYGRWNGYFYIDFEGHVSPCVFVPYSSVNIKDIYAQGGNIADALQTPFFKNGRKWQKQNGFDKTKDNNGDYLLTPCSIRDNYQNFRENILTPDAMGIDEEAKNALKDEEYKKIMIEYGTELKKLTRKIYNEKFAPSLELEEVE
jgi:Predicted Fe-S oxidoreductases